MIDMASKARLFCFPVNAHEALPKRHPPEELEEIRDMFVLPFDVVAVEDNATCVLIQDLRNNEPGISHPRIFIECIPGGARMEAFRDGLNFTPPPGGNKLSVVSMGVLKTVLVGETRLEMDCSAITVFVYDGNKPIDASVLPSSDPLAATFARNWATALEELMLLNTKDKFILEKAPAKTRKNPRKIPRSHERPIYTVLHPRQIREVMGLGHPEASGRHVSPHERRAHPRRFRSERFTKMKGKTIIIPATWIGPSEKRKGKHIYRVLLDR